MVQQDRFELVGGRPKLDSGPEISKSEVAIASLLRQTKQPKKFLLQVKTITKSTGNGIAESVKFAIYIKKAGLKLKK